MYSTDIAPLHALSPIPARARHELHVLLRSAGWPGDCDSVVLAVHEALINSLRHAGGATSASAGVSGSAVVVEICDAGPGFDIDRHAHRPPEPLAESGRGLWLISQLAAHWEVQRHGGQICLRLEFAA